MARTEELDSVKGKPSAKSAAKKSRLDEPAVQDAILEPKPFTVIIAGEERELHALSAKRNRELDGFFRIVLADTIGGDATAVRSLRMVGVLLDRYSERAIRFIAAATEPAGSLSDSGIDARASEIDARIFAQEVADAFVAICDHERVLERYTRATEGLSAAPK